MKDMEIQVYPQTATALKEDLTLRCLLRAKYHRDKSRLSADVIPWAQSRVERASSAVVREVGQQTAGFTTQMNMIEMLGTPNIVYICSDLFLNECDERRRTEISEDFHTQRPIHQITKKGNAYIMWRDARLDAEVARMYLDKSSVDKGPRPLFWDLRYPPFYAEGRRVEYFEDVMEVPDPVPEGHPLAKFFHMYRDRKRPAAGGDERRGCQEKPDDEASHSVS